MLRHPKVRNNLRIVVVRIYEFDEVKKAQDFIEAGKKKWQVTLDKIIDRDGPVLVLDYTYFALLANKNAPVGGLIYGRSAKLNGVAFYAPFSQWSERLGELFVEEKQGMP